eukprot:5353811-Pyramimonas_sp.AAC.1
MAFRLRKPLLARCVAKDGRPWFHAPGWATVKGDAHGEVEAYLCGPVGSAPPLTSPAGEFLAHLASSQFRGATNVHSNFKGVVNFRNSGQPAGRNNMYDGMGSMARLGEASCAG